tara:strand:+ start:348 stop:1358 length:1011 start_codon:yes stop_codon:yes gene_type:complete
MGMIGNQPANNFLAVTKDTFNGNASSYTLSKAATTNGVAVFVENVRQIPTTAYSVSGTTLTFTGTTPAGTGNVYVLHHNTPASTATHPAAQALEATSGTFTGDVTVDTTTLKVDSTNNRVGVGTASPSDTLHVKGFARIESNAGDAAYVRFDNDVNSGGKIWRAGAGVSSHGTFSIYNQTDNKFGINVNSNGFVNMPLQPRFWVRNSTSENNQNNNTAANPFIFNTAMVNSGAYYSTSNGRFTAPVAGHYYFFYTILSKASNSPNSGADTGGRIQKNGADIAGSYTYGNTGGLALHFTVTNHAIVSLAVNDYVTLQIQYSGTYGGEHTSFGGYLIG